MDTLKPGNAVLPKGVRVEPTYRPAGSLIHRVSDGENWGTLAARYKREASEIIKDNFDTSNPYEINWYLQEYVKCDKATPDRYNWQFSTSSRSRGGVRPGIIYIQPNWYAILDAAKVLAKKAIIEWFTGAFLQPVPINAKFFELRGSNLSWYATFLSTFESSLRWHGATDDLAALWAKAVHRALLEFSQSIHSFTLIPAPSTNNSLNNKTPGSAGLKWHGLHGATTGTSAFMNLSACDGLSLANATALGAIKGFTQWWRQRMENVAGKAFTEVNINGHYFLDEGIWRAIALPGNVIYGVELAVSVP